MSNDLNHVTLIGRLTRDAELKYLSSGTPVCKFSIAVGKKVKKGDNWEDDVSFLEIVLWGKSGESINQYLVKGKQVAIDGELHQNRWEKDGQTHSKIEIIASSVQLLGGNDAKKESPKPQAKSDPDSAEGNPSDFPDDIPF